MSDLESDATPRFTRQEAFKHFAQFEGRTQSQRHIRPLHDYVTCRLVLEGGFHPDELSPRPPLRVTESGQRSTLIYDPQASSPTVDIVANKEGIGPVLAVSCKGMTGAVRNLTNRLEETIGECTNIHIAYPTLVFGYLFLIRANREGGVGRTDVVVDRAGKPVEGVIRFHQALSAMSGRLGIRDDASRYEAIAMALIEVAPPEVGEISSAFPAADSAIHFDHFFRTLYQRYDERYVVSAPLLAKRTRRLVWSSDSPALQDRPFLGLDYTLRTG